MPFLPASRKQRQADPRQGGSRARDVAQFGEFGTCSVRRASLSKDG